MKISRPGVTAWLMLITFVLACLIILVTAGCKGANLPGDWKVDHITAGVHQGLGNDWDGTGVEGPPAKTWTGGGSFDGETVLVVEGTWDLVTDISTERTESWNRLALSLERAAAAQEAHDAERRGEFDRLAISLNRAAAAQQTAADRIESALTVALLTQPVPVVESQGSWVDEEESLDAEQRSSAGTERRVGAGAARSPLGEGVLDPPPEGEGVWQGIMWTLTVVGIALFGLMRFGLVSFGKKSG